MIKAIAFDFGGVYFHWDHHKFGEKMGPKFGIDPKQYTAAYTNEVSKAHKGEITAEQQFQHIAEYLYEHTGKKPDPKEMFKIMYSEFQPMHEMWELARKLRENGYTIMLFSNHTTMMDDLNDEWKFYEHFDHPIVSAHVGMEKPEPEFYQHLIKTAACKPEEIIFIDDLERNIAAAKKEGIQGIVFDGDMQKLLAELEKQGVKV